MTAAPRLREVTLTLCELCIDGAGGECHVPGCALWMNRAPDIPLDAPVSTEPIFDPCCPCRDDHTSWCRYFEQPTKPNTTEATP